MSTWAQAIGFITDDEGAPSLEMVIGHIRAAVVEAGFVSRGRITLGLKEAYRPITLDESLFAPRIEEALRVLRLSGDLDEYTTAAGRGYAPTLPRRVDWGGEEVATLGAAGESGASIAVRRNARDAVLGDIIANVSLRAELGRPEWRNALVELGGVDAPSEGPAALFRLVHGLAASGERYELAEPGMVAVLSGRGDFFGKTDPMPTGRWQRVRDDGCFAAVIKSGYGSRTAVLNITAGKATIWFPPNRDVWRWVVVGQTLATGDPVLRFNAAIGKLDFLTEPPSQVERSVLLTGSQTSAWSWRVDAQAYVVIEGLMSSMR
jgi:hypothetical protein